MDFIDQLIREHREIEASLRRFIDDAVSGRPDPAAIRAMCQKLHLHMVTEEHVIFPQVKTELSSEEEIEMIEDSIEEHSALKDLMIKLLAENLDQVACPPLFEEMLVELVHHHQDEETELFPAARDRLNKKKFGQIDEAVLIFREENRGEFQPASLSCRI